MPQRFTRVFCIGETVLDPHGNRFIITEAMTPGLVPRYLSVAGEAVEDGELVVSPHDTPQGTRGRDGTQQYLPIATFDRDGWTQVSALRKEVMAMDKQPETPKSSNAAYFGGKTPQVKVTKQYLRAKGKVSVTLTRAELEELGDLVRAGHALLRGRPPVSKALRAAMSKLDLDTNGL